MSLDLASLTFLLVEDSAYMRTILRTMLQGFGARRIVEAEDGASGLEAMDRANPDILILEGLGFQPRAAQAATEHEPDLLIYLDAELAHIEGWFLERFLRFWHAAEHDPTSFYAQFRHMSEEELITFAKSVWAGINLPNLENHILPLRAHADLVVRKDAAHAVTLAEDRWPGP